jgi:hypothetical protein
MICFNRCLAGTNPHQKIYETHKTNYLLLASQFFFLMQELRIKSMIIYLRDINLLPLESIYLAEWKHI